MATASTPAPSRPEAKSHACSSSTPCGPTWGSSPTAAHHPVMDLYTGEGTTTGGAP